MVNEPLEKYCAMVCTMSLKIQILHSHMDVFPEMFCLKEGKKPQGHYCPEKKEIENGKFMLNDRKAET